MNNIKQKQSLQLEDVQNENSNFETNKMGPFFKGRIGRNEFAWSYFMFVIVSIVGQIYSSPDDWGLLLIIGITTGICAASLIVERLHDLGRPGYHYWLVLIPFYNIYFLLFELCGEKGQVGSNKYGFDPLKQKIKAHNKV
ncbi:MAG: DUF805 domain-containing protein [Bacteroidetes bacterium]|nr:DUF805 domain-containing protein [Bacteroidota bacterium]